jgi:putative ABC transport system ATP-binding protein
LTLGQLVASELIVTTVVAGFAKFGKYLETYYDLVAAADKLGYLLDLPLEQSLGPEALSGLSTDPRYDPCQDLKASKQPASVKLKGVTFQYHKQVQSLSEVDLEIKPGARVAILGDNGSGKSTLTSLIFGLRKPDRGRVEIDGIDLREVQIEKLRCQMAFVRGVEIFDGSILENVRMNRPEIQIKDVRDTLDQLGLLESITALPDGVFTRLSGSQSPLSAGQMQRLMLARAIVGKPRLLILDESLDNIDEGAHDKIIDVLFDHQAPWTLILTTHNIEIVSFCDQVYFLTKGKIREGRVLLK